MRNGLIAGSAALAVAIAACAAGEERTGGPSSDARRIDVCRLATPGEVATIVGAERADTSGMSSEHSYTKPVTYSASCAYTSPGELVMVAIHYPVLGAVPTPSDLAASVTRHMRSQDESDSVLAELYRTLQVRPVSDLPAPAAEYEIAGTTTLEARVGERALRVSAGSLDVAKRVARTMIERLD